MSEPAWWSEEGLRFTCTRCGACCQGPEPGYVEVNRTEVERLAEHLGLEPDAFGRRYLRRVQGGKVSLTEHPNGDCIFWERGRGCSVYELRPTQCRTFPFWPEVVASPEDWEEQQEMCPGMGEGRRYPPERIEAILAGQGQTEAGREPRPGVESRGRPLRTASPGKPGKKGPA